MNLNQLAVEISKREGGKQNLSIAQIKEVLRHMCDIIAEDQEQGELAPSSRLLASGRRRINSANRKKKNGKK